MDVFSLRTKAPTAHQRVEQEVPAALFYSLSTFLRFFCEVAVDNLKHPSERVLKSACCSRDLRVRQTSTVSQVLIAAPHQRVA